MCHLDDMNKSVANFHKVWLLRKFPTSVSHTLISIGTYIFAVHKTTGEISVKNLEYDCMDD